MNKLAISVPQSRPLRSDNHLVVTEDSVHVVDWVLENFAWLEWAVLRVYSIGECQI